MNTNTTALLRASTLFGNLKDKELAMVEHAFEDVTLTEGARPIEEGHTHGRLYVIAEGRVELRGHGPDGKEHTLVVLGVNDCFGECALTPDAPSLITAEVVLGPARLLALRGDSIIRLIRITPEIGVGMLAAAFARIQQLQRLIVLQG